MAVALAIAVSTVHSASADQQTTAPPQPTTSAASAQQPLELDDKMQTVNGRIDGDGVGEFRYYSFKALRGQNVLLRLEKLQHPFIFQYKLEDKWLTLVQDQPQVFHGLTPGQEVQVRVSKAIADVVNNTFHFRMGSAPYRASADEITTDAQHLMHFFNVFQAFRTVNWSIALKDSKGYPVEGATNVLSVDLKLEKKVEIITDASGRGSATLVLPECVGGTTDSPVYQRKMGPYQYRWKLIYNQHRLTTKIEDNPLTPHWQEGMINNTFGHICKEWLLG